MFGFSLGGGQAYASAARTTAQTGATIDGRGARGVIVYLHITVASGLGGLQPRVVAVDDRDAGQAYQLAAAPAAKTAVGVYAYVYYPAAVAAAGDLAQVVNTPLPPHWRIDVAVGDASSYTYAVNYDLLP